MYINKKIVEAPIELWREIKPHQRRGRAGEKQAREQADQCGETIRQGPDHDLQELP